MFNQNDHLTDEDLLLLRDDELSPAKAYRVRRHFGVCLDCRSRSADLERTISDLADLEAKVYRQMPSNEASRVHLKAQIGTALRTSPHSRTKRPASAIMLGHWAYSIVALICVAFGGYALYQNVRSAASVSAADYFAERPVPNANLTPGATRTVTLNDICQAGTDSDDDQDPIVASSVRRAVFQEYSIADAPAGSYQVDYLISPQLGGTDDVRNLWPQPYSRTVWNARAKDALEARLHQMVCDKQIDLESAQHEIAKNWISAYQKVFNTRDPL